MKRGVLSFSWTRALSFALTAFNVAVLTPRLWLRREAQRLSRRRGNKSPHIFSFYSVTVKSSIENSDSASEFFFFFLMAFVCFLILCHLTAFFTRYVFDTRRASSQETIHTFTTSLASTTYEYKQNTLQYLPSALSLRLNPPLKPRPLLCSAQPSHAHSCCPFERRVCRLVLGRSLHVGSKRTVESRSSSTTSSRNVL